MLEISYSSIPLAIRLSFGFVQALAIFYFILYISDINLPFKRLLLMASVKSILKDIILTFLVFNIFAYYALFTLINTLFVSIFSEKFNYKIIIAAVLVDFISLLTKPTIAFMLYQKGIQADGNVTLLWLLMGIPQIVIYLGLVYMLRKTKFLYSN